MEQSTLSVEKLSEVTSKTGIESRKHLVQEKSCPPLKAKKLFLKGPLTLWEEIIPEWYLQYTTTVSKGAAPNLLRARQT